MPNGEDTGLRTQDIGGSEFAFSLDVTVDPSAIDELGHVNNAVYLQYVELIARAHASAAGYPAERFYEIGGVFVVRRHEVTYFGPAYANDNLILKTRIEKIAGARCTRRVEIWRRSERLVEAITEWVWMDPNDHAPKRIPLEIAVALPATIR